ncbi:MAG: hypothetical protein ACK515_27905 [bacterium]
MKHSHPRAWLLAAACCVAAPVPAWALDLASSTASSASSAGSASVGSLSDSLRSSSQSAGGPRQMADGEYRVIELAASADRPGEMRLTLQPMQPTAPTAAGVPADVGAEQLRSEQWELRLPRALVEREGLDTGHLVRAAQRPYGVAFAQAGQPRPFFLVLAQEWQRELPARPVKAAGGS